MVSKVGKENLMVGVKPQGEPQEMSDTPESSVFLGTLAATGCKEEVENTPVGRKIEVFVRLECFPGA